MTTEVDEFLNKIEVGNEDLDRLHSAVNDSAGTYTDANGNVVSNLRARLDALGVDIPVPFTAGISVSSVTKSVTYNGVIYSARSDAVPFTTTSTFESNQWQTLPYHNSVEQSAAAAVSASQAADRSEVARDLAETYAGVNHRASSWTALSAISGVAGDTGYVSEDDTGTHTDPITSGTVNNAGVYGWAADGLGSAQAERVGSTGLVGKVSFSDGVKKTLTELPSLSTSGVELLGFDTAGRAVMRLSPDVLNALAKSGEVGGLGHSPSDSQKVLTLEGIELLGFDSKGRARFSVSPDVARQVAEINRGEFDAEAYKVIPSSDIAIWGTSLSARGGNIVSGVEDAKLTVYNALAQESGRSVFNGAVGGTNSYAISIRQGGRDFPCTLTGGELPADTTAVTLIDYGGHDAYNNQTDQFRYGTLGGVPCVLRRLSDGGDATVTTGWTVERREVAGSATPIPDGTPFIFDGAIANVGRTHIFEAMRNDLYDTRAQITAQRDNILSMCGYAGEAVADARFLVIGPWPATYETIGSSGRTKAENRRTEMKKTFGPNFVDLWDYMVDWAIYDLGMTPTADDLIDMGNGIIPRSLMDDNVHPNAAGNRAIGREYNRQLIARGW